MKGWQDAVHPFLPLSDQPPPFASDVLLRPD